MKSKQQVTGTKLSASGKRKDSPFYYKGGHTVRMEVLHTDLLSMLLGDNEAKEAVTRQM